MQRLYACGTDTAAAQQRGVHQEPHYADDFPQTEFSYSRFKGQLEQDKPEHFRAHRQVRTRQEDRRRGSSRDAGSLSTAVPEGRVHTASVQVSTCSHTCAPLTHRPLVHGIDISVHMFTHTCATHTRTPRPQHRYKCLHVHTRVRHSHTDPSSTASIQVSTCSHTCAPLTHRPLVHSINTSVYMFTHVCATHTWTPCP